MTTKRGINLGCGNIIMPCEKPEHHAILPDDVYEDDAIQWDNADWQAQPGVNVVMDLFDYPWRNRVVPFDVAASGVSVGFVQDDTYDVALCTHLVEHIPHAVKRNGVVTDVHGGWYAFWDELARVLKPGGQVYIITPYGFSRGGLIDPTHTRYMLPETFGYLSASEEGAPFNKPLKATWEITYGPMIAYTPYAWQQVQNIQDEAVRNQALQHIASTTLNAISEFALVLKVNK